MIADRRLQHQEFIDRLKRVNQLAAEIEKQRNADTNALALGDEELSDALQERATGVWHVTRYVDLEKGISLRQELATTVNYAVRGDITGCTISQVFQS